MSLSYTRQGSYRVESLNMRRMAPLVIAVILAGCAQDRFNVTSCMEAPCQTAAPEAADTQEPTEPKMIYWLLMAITYPFLSL